MPHVDAKDVLWYADDGVGQTCTVSTGRHKPINALDRNAVRDVIGQPEWGIFASVCSVSIVATLTKLDKRKKNR